MAKIALVFLFAFCVIQLSAGARIPRDTDVGKVLEDTSKNFENFLKSTFTEENMEKIKSGLKEFGDKISEHSKAIAGQVNEQIQKMQEKKDVAA